MKVFALLPLGFALLWGLPTAEARKPANVYKGRVILDTKPFPPRFKSDRAFIRYMKKAHKKTINYGDKMTVHLELMAFFRKDYAATEFTGMIFDITTGKRSLVNTFSIYPQQRKTRILASDIELTKEEFPEERKYYLVVTIGQTILAETRFTIKESAAARAKRKAKERALKQPQTINFE